MNSKHDELLKKLLATFRLEADGHLQNMVAGLLSLEKTPVAEQPALVEVIFQPHTALKGAARAVNLTHVEAVCGSLENVFSATKDRRLIISSDLIDLLLQATDVLGRLVDMNDAEAIVLKLPVATLIRQLADTLTSPAPELPMPEPEREVRPTSSDRTSADSVADTAPRPARARGSATVRVSAEKLDVVMRQVEELLLRDWRSAIASRRLAVPPQPLQPGRSSGFKLNLYCESLIASLRTVFGTAVIPLRPMSSPSSSNILIPSKFR